MATLEQQQLESQRKTLNYLTAEHENLRVKVEQVISEQASVRDEVAALEEMQGTGSVQNAVTSTMSLETVGSPSHLRSSFLVFKVPSDSENVWAMRMWLPRPDETVFIDNVPVPAAVSMQTADPDTGWRFIVDGANAGLDGADGTEKLYYVHVVPNETSSSSGPVTYKEWLIENGETLPTGSDTPDLYFPVFSILPKGYGDYTSGPAPYPYIHQIHTGLIISGSAQASGSSSSSSSSSASSSGSSSGSPVPPHPGSSSSSSGPSSPGDCCKCDWTVTFDCNTGVLKQYNPCLGEWVVIMNFNQYR